MIQLGYGVDYLTATAPVHTEADAALQAVFDAIRFDDMAQGYDEKAARALGTVGQQVGPMYLGSEGTYRMLRISGEWASTAVEMLAMMGGKPKITRIDVQVTVGRIYDVADTAERTAEAVRLWQAENRQASHPKPRLILGYGQGDTFNLGSRSSETYIRVYDKSREQSLEGPPWYWRYEVELKGQRAIQAFEMICMSGHTQEACREVVEAYCDARGIPLPWGKSTTWEPAELPRPDTDDEKALTWLKTQVRPTVVRLKKKLGAAYIQEALWLDSTE